MNQPRQRGPVARFFIGLWDAINFTRRLAFNLLFLLLLVFFLALLMSGGQGRTLAGDNTLVIAPEGRLVEQYSIDPVGRALAQATGQPGGEVRVRDLLRAIDAAKDDKRIARVLLRVDRLQPTGFASLREVAAALAELRASGKQVIAFGENFTQFQYLLAAQADTVYLDPMGGLVLEGLGRYRQYYREGLQDKLGVDVHLFKVGEYKSAAEPYVLDAASPEAKQADLYWMNDVWNRYLADIARARDLNATQLAADIEQLPQDIATARGDLAQYALQHGLVDKLMTRGELFDMLVEQGVADDNAPGGFRQVSMSAYLQHLDGALLDVEPGPQVAIVVAEGQILGGKQLPGTIGGESTSALLRQARDDDNVKAVVLRVDSPGGAVFPSEQIRREVVALKQAGKPVVVSMGDLAASGGYWISMNADRIYANPSTITGSIGIFGLFPTIPRALDKIGVHTDGVGTTRFAGAFDITRPLDPAVGTMIQTVIEKGYRDFIGRVAKARGKTVEQVDAIARGRVWTGAQALERGLVDEFGGLQAAVADAARRVKLEDGEYQVRYIEPVGTPLERFLAGIANSRMGAAWLRDADFARGLMAHLLPQTRNDLQFLQQALQPGQGRKVKALAYCFCEMR